MSGIVKFAVKGVAASIGLASESVKAHKERKAAREAENAAALEEPEHAFVTDVNGTVHRASVLEVGNILKEDVQERPRISSISKEDLNYSSTEADLGKTWRLDEAQDQLSHSRSPSPAPCPQALDPGSLADDFLRQNPSPMAEGTDLQSMGRLSLPVVLPQRRPTDRSRGFVRAYATDLETCGITQQMFISFLDKFDKSTQASPLLLTLNLAALGLEFAPIPSLVGMVAAIGTHEASVVAMELHARSKTNSFLDKINDDFFRPRGLYCLIMTYDPDTASSVTGAVDISSHITSTVSSSLTVPTGSMRQKVMHRLQSSSGDDFGNLGAMETAPLIYPKLEEVAKGKRARVRAVGSFVSDFKDRRAQAHWASENPTSSLAQGPKPQFRSRYSDPNHPASSGDLLALVTGGKISATNLRGKMSLSSSKSDVNDHDNNYPPATHNGTGDPTQMYGHNGYSSNVSNPAFFSGNHQAYAGYCNGSNPPAPYGGSSGNSNFASPSYSNPPAPYGGSKVTSNSFPGQYSDPPAPYGGSHYPNQYPQPQYPYQHTQQYVDPKRRDSDEEEERPAKEDRSSAQSMLKNVLRENVLYMMIVNMPSEEEMLQAKKALGERQLEMRAMQ